MAKVTDLYCSMVHCCIWKNNLEMFKELNASYITDFLFVCNLVLCLEMAK